MEIIAAMVIAFILGAYIRQPFVLFNRNKITDMTLTREKHFTMDIDEEAKAEVEAMLGEKKKSIDRATQIENMWNYTERVALEKDKEADI